MISCIFIKKNLPPREGYEKTGKPFRTFCGLFPKSQAVFLCPLSRFGERTEM
jgi:hypothetical protein